MSRWKKRAAGALCLLLALTPAAPCAADESARPTGPVSEYVSDTLFDNFEEQAAPAAATAEALNLSCTAAVLMERTGGRVVVEKNADEQRAPASITKIMTLLLVMEAIEDGRLALTDKVTGSAHARSMGGSQIWLEEGEVMTVDDLLKAVCVASANDAAVALAEHLAGSEEAFVAEMNERAAALGMAGTRFVNCCGLDAPGHLTTARDIAVMARALLAHPLITEYSTIYMDTLRGGETQLVNTNKLVRFYNGATGLKTGTTDEAGYCVAASAKREGMELIAVVLNGATSDKRFSDAKALLDYGFAHYALAPTPAFTPPAPVAVRHGAAGRVAVTAEPAGPFLVPKGKQGSVTATVTLSEAVEAPVAAGQPVGKVSYLLEGELLGESRLLAAAAVERLTFGRAVALLLRRLVQL